MRREKKVSLSVIKSIIKEIFKTEQRPDKNISLDFEHELSVQALKCLQNSLENFYSVLISVSRKLYPKEFLKLGLNF